MIITKKTYVSQILKEYGDIAEIMEVFGVKRAGSWGLRKLITHFITIKSAAKFHKSTTYRIYDDGTNCY